MFSYSLYANSLKNAYNVSYNAKNTIISNSVSYSLVTNNYYTVFNTVSLSYSYTNLNAYNNSNSVVNYVKTVYSYNIAYVSYYTSSFYITLIDHPLLFFGHDGKTSTLVCLGNANLPDKDRGVSLWTDVSVYRSSSALLSTFYQQPFNNLLKRIRRW